MRSSPSVSTMGLSKNLRITYKNEQGDMVVLTLPRHRFQSGSGTLKLSAITLGEALGCGGDGDVFAVSNGVPDKGEREFVLKRSNDGKSSLNHLLGEQGAMLALGVLVSDVLIWNEGRRKFGCLLMERKLGVNLFSFKRIINKGEYSCDVNQEFKNALDVAKQPITIFEYWQIFIAVCEALNENFFKKGWIHCDIKLENLMINPRREEGRRFFEINAVDYAFARELANKNRNIIMGTPITLPPEVWAIKLCLDARNADRNGRGEKPVSVEELTRSYDQSKDELAQRCLQRLSNQDIDLTERTIKGEIYSLGATFYDLLCGFDHFRNETAKNFFIATPAPLWPTRFEGGSQELVELVVNNLSILPDEDICFIVMLIKSIINDMMSVDPHARPEIENVIQAWKKLDETYRTIEGCDKASIKMNGRSECFVSGLLIQIEDAPTQVEAFNYMAIMTCYLKNNSASDVLAWIHCRDLFAKIKQEKFIENFLESLKNDQESYLYPGERLQMFINYCQQCAVKHLQQDIEKGVYTDCGLAGWQNVLLFLSAILVVPILYIAYRVFGPGLFTKTPDGINNLVVNIEKNNGKLDFSEAQEIIQARGAYGIFSSRCSQTRTLYSSFVQQHSAMGVTAV